MPLGVFLSNIKSKIQKWCKDQLSNAYNLYPIKIILKQFE